MHDDGVIKYRCEWQCNELAFENEEALMELIVWRDRLHAAGLIGVYPDGVGFGNVSRRLTRQSFGVTGTQTGHHMLSQPAHYTLVDRWNIDQNALHCVGPIKASSESLTHAALYEHSADIQAVVHVHHASLWATYQHKLPTTSADVPYGTPAMAYEMWRLFRESELCHQKILVMAGHEDGLIAFGNSLSAAVAILLELLDQLARC
ncbi:MAG: class II aldolase/adducin family protein [Cyanobacteria bacterium J06636_16]